MVLEGDPFKTKVEIFEWLQAEGFITPNHGQVPRSDFLAIEKLKEEYEAGRRAALDYEIDGLVIETDCLETFEREGESSGRPKASRAYKFQSATATTVLEDVVWQRGRTVISPVGILKPVELGGVTISRVSLCNLDEIERLQAGIGSEVLISRRNDVIPKLEKALSEGFDIKIPSECPSCSAPTRSDGTRLFCTGTNCGQFTAKTIIHYLKALDVKGLGEKQAVSLVERGVVQTPADLYRLKPEDFESAKIGVKVLKDLAAKSRDVPVYHFVKSLGFKLFGRGNTKKVLKEIPTFEGIRNATVDELVRINEIGPEVAEAAVEGFAASSELIDELLQHVTLMDHTKPKSTISGDLEGQSFVFTGFQDKAAEAKIEARGGKISSSVSKKLTYLVAKDVNSTSSKVMKARSLGVAILSVEQFQQLI